MSAAAYNMSNNHCLFEESLLCRGGTKVFSPIILSKNLFSWKANFRIFVPSLLKRNVVLYIVRVNTSAISGNL